MNNNRVLLIEDTRDDESLTLRGLEGAGLQTEIQVARDGAAALELLQTDPSLPALVILDLKLPKIDGAELLRRIREDKRLCSLCVAVFTSSNEPRDITRCYELGCNSYVIKPVNYESYSNAIRQIGSYWLGLNVRNRG